MDILQSQNYFNCFTHVKLPCPRSLQNFAGLSSLMMLGLYQYRYSWAITEGDAKPNKNVHTIYTFIRYT
jgi:hypothetical protein